MRARTVVLALAGLMSVPAMAVGLGPLSKQGVTDGPAKGFYLTVTNPYRTARQFKLSTSQSEVEIVPDNPTIAGGRQRRVLVIARNLAPGERREFDVCAQLAKSEGIINARVCSKLSARRVYRRP